MIVELFLFRFERTIVNVDRGGRTFTIDIPMVMNFDPKYQQEAMVYHLASNYPMISDVGIENLRLSNRNSRDPREIWRAVEIDNTIHGWVSDVAIDTFRDGIRASKGSRFITIQNCNVDYQGHDRLQGLQKGFVLSGQMGLVNNCTATGAFYDFTSEASTYGKKLNIILHALTLKTTLVKG